MYMYVCVYMYIYIYVGPFLNSLGKIPPSCGPTLRAGVRMHDPSASRYRSGAAPPFHPWVGYHKVTTVISATCVRFFNGYNHKPYHKYIYYIHILYIYILYILYIYYIYIMLI